MLEAKIQTGGLRKIADILQVRAETLEQGLMVSIASWLHMVVKKSFATDSTAEGVPWAPWSAKYAAKGHGKGMLEKSGALFEQLNRGATIDGNTVTMGSTLPYAGVHQFGFEGDVSVREFIHSIHSPKGDVWAKVMGKNRKFVRGKIAYGVKFPRTPAHSRHMKIPARPFLPTPEFVEAEGSKIVQEFVDREIKNALEE